MSAVIPYPAKMPNGAPTWSNVSQRVAFWPPNLSIQTGK